MTPFQFTIQRRKSLQNCLNLSKMKLIDLEKSGDLSSKIFCKQVLPLINGILVLPSGSPGGCRGRAPPPERSVWAAAIF